jgi:hypothetical protein
VPTRQEISDAVQEFYPKAIETYGVGYIVLGPDHNIIRMDPTAEEILKTTEARSLNKSLSAFLPEGKTTHSHGLQVDGMMAQLARKAKAGKNSAPVAMGRGSDGKQRAVPARTAERQPISLMFDVCALPVGESVYPIAFFYLAEQDIQLNLAREKERVMVQAAGPEERVNKVAHLLLTIFERTVNLFQGIYGQSRVGKIFAGATSFAFWGGAIYTGLVIAKIAPPPDFSGDDTIQNITAPAIGRPDGDNIDVSADRPSTPAKGDASKK